MTSLEQIELIFTNAIEKIKNNRMAKGRKVSAHFPLYINIEYEIRVKGNMSLQLQTNSDLENLIH